MLRVYSYCKHFYLQGQVYQHSRQLKSVIIYLRVFECRSVALAENQPSEGCKTTAKASVRHRLVIVGHTCFIISALSCMKGRWAGLQSASNWPIVILNVLHTWLWIWYLDTNKGFPMNCHQQKLMYFSEKAGTQQFLWKCKMH